MGVVCISGLPGCGSSSIGRLLAERLDLKFFSAGKEYKKYGKGDKETDRAIDFLGSEKGTGKEVNNSLDDLQVDLARKGNIVIDSKAGIHFLKDIANLKVWLNADFDVRARRVSMREKWDFNKATEKLKQKELLEGALFQKVYGIDYLLQEKDADLVLDVSKLNKNKIVEKILEKLNNGS